MANYTELNTLFTDMANAIRAKNGSTSTIIADNFPTKIEELRTGFDYNNHYVTSIPDYAFYDCEDLKSVDCYNLTSVGVSAFENCKNLKSVILYEGVETVGENAFKGCDCIIYCAATSKPDTWHENWNPDNCEVVWKLLVETWDVSATEEDSIVANLYNDINNNGMYTLVISGSGNVKDYNYSNKMAPWHDYSSSIKTVIILHGITRLGDYALYNCTSLTSVVIPNSVTSIGTAAFLYCVGLTSIVIPNSVTNINSGAFQSCTNLSYINIPNNVNSIDNYTFDQCISLISISLPDSVTVIGEYAFRNCQNLTTINVPDGILYIGNYVFQGCNKLTSINIPGSVTSIGNSAFASCTKLASITYMSTIVKWKAITFGPYWNNGTPDYTIHCTDGDIAKDGTITYH